MMSDTCMRFSCSCTPCKQCILLQFSQLETNKLYREADQVLTDGIVYYSTVVKDLQEERMKFRSKLKRDPYFKKLLEESEVGTSNSSCQATLVNVSSSYKLQKIVKFPQHQSFTNSATNDIRSEDLSCPVAIFDSVNDPKQKSMYPKHLVYADGKDIQLEEIRAAAYWSKIQKESAPEKTTDAGTEFEVFNDAARPSLKNTPAADITNLPRSISKAKLKVYPENKEFLMTSSDCIENVEPHFIISSPLKSTVEDRSSRSPFTIRSLSKLTTDDSCKRKSTTLQNVADLILSKGRDRNIEQEMKDCIPDQQSVCTNDGKNCRNMPKNTISKENIRTDNSDQNCYASTSLPERTSRNEYFSEINRLTASLPFPKETNVNSNKKFNDLNLETLKENVANSFRVQKSFEAIKSVENENSHKEKGSHILRKHNSPSEVFLMNKETVPGPSAVPSIDVLVPPFSSSAKDEQRTSYDDVLKNISEDEEDTKLGKTFTVLNHEEIDDTCDTKAFAGMLPSSTPNQRKSQLFKQPANSNGTYIIDAKTSVEYTSMNVVTTTGQNLSMILELSKERSSCSSGGNSETGYAITSKTSVIPDKNHLCAINETDENESSKPHSHVVPDPFNTELIQSLLGKIKISLTDGSNEFYPINSDMPLIKQSSTVKLGDEKLSVVGEIGKGSYARILKAHTVNKPTKLVALKLQKPSCVWEYYISREIRRRLNLTQSQYFMDYSNIYIYKNGSILVSEWAQYGSILNFINTLKMSIHNRCPTAVVIYMSIQLITAVNYLHSCQIIHGDIKPDNFVLYRAITSDKPFIKLIDYGRSIDMTLFPENTVFSKVVTTEDFTCNEMKENKPWTFQTDLYGLAGTMYLLLVGEYMKTVKRQDGTWVLKKPLSRYMNKDLWNPIFDSLLNVPSCSDLPNLVSLKCSLEDFYSLIDKYTVAQQFSTVSNLLKK